MTEVIDSLKNRPVWRMVRRVVLLLDNPLTHLLIGGLVLCAGLIEVVKTFNELVTEYKFHAGHGVMFAGLSQVVKATHELVKQVEKRA